ncbi:MAG: SpoIIE family protein phosphatase [Deltaproteobacteria bacterium]|nr:SpoIIE family protein phosphatase [Deltaproteobacteria bacterium]
MQRADGIVIALADGAGGTGNGDVAAQAVIDAVAAAPTSTAWAALLAELDREPARLGCGQTTAVIVAVTASGLVVTSVGDSGAWIVRGTTLEDLTADQSRKPLVGSGCAPFTVHAGPLAGGTLLVASDGLLKYAKPRDIALALAGDDLAVVARALVDLVRLPSGALQDDVALVLCREA